MHDEIARRIEQRMSKRPRFRVERVTTADDEGDRDSSLLSAHVTSELERHMKEMYDDKDALEAAAQPRATVREFGGLRTRRQLEKHFVERLSVDIGTPERAFDFTVPGGSKVFGPPYDRDWAEGNGIAFGGRVDGKVITIPKTNGFSAAAIGFYLTTTDPVLAAITPQGTYDWNWIAAADLPFDRSSGGMGITIYTNSEPQPTMSRQPVLWSVSGMTTLSGQKGSGRIADAASPAFGFGTVPLAPALVNLVPGSRYLVWVWCWQTARLEKDDPFIAFLGFSLPFVTIDAGPPILIH
jgi:hypothetical protein